MKRANYKEGQREVHPSIDVIRVLFAYIYGPHACWAVHHFLRKDAKISQWLTCLKTATVPLSLPSTNCHTGGKNASLTLGYNNILYHFKRIFSIQKFRFHLHTPKHLFLNTCDITNKRKTSPCHTARRKNGLIKNKQLRVALSIKNRKLIIRPQSEVQSNGFLFSN